MKSFLTAFIISLCLSACSSPGRILQAANEPLGDGRPAVPDLHETSPSEAMPDDVLITFDGYDWKEDFFRIFSEKASDNMKEGSDYGYHENTGSFSKELVFTEEFSGQPFRTYYDFDGEDRLVSVMMVLHRNLPPVDTVSLYLSILQDFTEIYGPCVSAEGQYRPEQGQSPEAYADAIEAGEIQSICTWTDSVGTQLLAECRRNPGSDQLDLIILYSTDGYTV